MTNMITFKNVSYRYQEDSPWVLRNCSFTINEGESVAIIGHNGSGKSTIAKLMNGLLFPVEGEIVVADTRLTEESVWDIRKKIGMVFQNPDNQFVGATVEDDVAFGMENRGIDRAEMQDRIDNALDTVNMTAYRLTEPHRLSGGQKQRIAIAGVLAIHPEIIILDEATVMLDPIGRNDMMNTMKKLKTNERLSYITITHDLDEIFEVDKVIVLNQGEVWDITTPRKLLKHGASLETIGLGLPFIQTLKIALEREGIALRQDTLTTEEMLEDLWKLHSTK